MSEELSHSFEARISGTVLTAVVIAGITRLAPVGNDRYFGHTSAELDFGRGWIAVVMCSVAGCLFAPSLSVRAGLGPWLAQLMPGAPVGAVALLGLVGYFSGVAQAPITATAIAMEMTDDQRITLPLLAPAFGVSWLACRRPSYGALARRIDKYLELLAKWRPRRDSNPRPQD